ncbi:uncharacterized protein [Macrobrachium rosenbergii]|uniref:uncharacterized protein n=1 Tax=Macrobrachium rosenbergii TaxID=79674 RepID=UPI0034D56C58
MEGNLLTKNLKSETDGKSTLRQFFNKPSPPRRGDIPPAQEDLNIDEGEALIVFRDGPWKDHGHYGIPEKLVIVIMNMLEGTPCEVMVDECLSDALEVKSSVIQGGILLPMLFVLVVDYVMRRVKRETDAGILWGENVKLLNLGYADDMVLICEGSEKIQRQLIA